jgi:hypothetical protein
MTVLQSCVTDTHFVDARPFGQCACHESGIQATLLDRQQQVFAFTMGFESTDFFNDKILGTATEISFQYSITVSTRQAHVFTSNTTACAAIPSPLPVKPSFSVVVALTDI